MKNNDNGMGELLEVLKTHPDLISALVFNPKMVKGFLKSRAARQLVLGVDTKAFLMYMAGDKGSGPVASCLRRTAQFCGIGSHCPVGICTEHPPPCDFHTIPPQPRHRAAGAKHQPNKRATKQSATAGRR